MKITIYTVSDCQFSKAEKEYLTAHNLPFEEKNLEQNREWLSEMLTVSNNFAGTPVTKIEKDDGQIIIVKGYNKEELDNILGLTPQNTATVNSTVDVPQTNQPSTQTTQPSSPPPSPAPTTTPPPPPQSTPSFEPQTQPSPTTTQNSSDLLNDVLNNLQQKAQEPTNPTPKPPISTTDPSPSSPPPPANLPNLPDFNDQQQ